MPSTSLQTSTLLHKPYTLRPTTPYTLHPTPLTAQALDCKWNMNAALEALHTIFQHLLGPSGPRGAAGAADLRRRADLIHRWAGLLWQASTKSAALHGALPDQVA